MGRNNPFHMSLWPNWTRRLTTNQKIGGSSPCRDMFFHPHPPVPVSMRGAVHTFCWGISSIGRVRALQARGTGIETLMLQAIFLFCFLSPAGLLCPPRPCIALGWPSGPRRLTQVQVSSDAWVRIPLQAYSLPFCWDPRSAGTLPRLALGCMRMEGHWSSGMILL